MFLKHQFDMLIRFLINGSNDFDVVVFFPEMTRRWSLKSLKILVEIFILIKEVPKECRSSFFDCA